MRRNPGCGCGMMPDKAHKRRLQPVFVCGCMVDHTKRVNAARMPLRRNPDAWNVR